MAGPSSPISPLLYELADDHHLDVWRGRCESYETALELFEASRFEEACRAIHPLLSSHLGRYDAASLNLFARSVSYHKTPPETFDPVFDLVHK